MHEQLAHTKELNESVSDNVSQFLTFMLNGENYGINILNIREIIDLGRITQVPMMADYIAGVINLRGSVVPVVDLALRFSLTPSERTNRSSIVILEVKDEEQSLEIGIIVGMVNEVLDISDTEIESSPSFGTRIRTDFIGGVGKINEQLLVLLDIDCVLCVDELSLLEQRQAG